MYTPATLNGLSELYTYMHTRVMYMHIFNNNNNNKLVMSLRRSQKDMGGSRERKGGVKMM